MFNVISPTEKRMLHPEVPIVQAEILRNVWGHHLRVQVAVTAVFQVLPEHHHTALELNESVHDLFSMLAVWLQN